MNASIIEIYDEQHRAYTSNIKVILEDVGIPVLGGIPELYHYTSFAGLEGIISSSCLRAYSGSSLDDPTEVLVGCEVFSEALTHTGRTLPHGSQAQLFVEKLLARLTKFEQSNGYLFSLTMARDDSFIWSLYGDNSKGYSIGFATTPFCFDFRPLAFVGQVMYMPKSQKRRAHSFCDDLLLPVLHQVMSDRFDQTKEDQLLDLFSFELELSVSCLKKIVYERESEIRAFSIKNGVWQKLTNFCLDEKLRSNGERMRSFVELRPTKHAKLPITSVCIGPDLTFEEESVRVRELLDSHGYSWVKILQSHAQLSNQICFY